MSKFPTVQAGKEPSQTASCSTARLGNIDGRIKHKLFFTVWPHSNKIKDNWTNVKVVNQSYKWLFSQLVHRGVVIWTCLSERSACTFIKSTAERSLLSPQSCLSTPMQRSLSFFQEPECFHHIYQNHYFFQGYGCERSASP